MTDQPAHDTRIAAAAQVEALAQATARSNKTMLDLVERVRHDAEAHERKVDLLAAGLRQTTRVLWLLAVVLVAVLAMAFINFATIAEAKRNGAVTAQAARDAQSTYKLLYGCFEPNSQCSKVNAAKQKTALDEIKKYELTALYCLRTNPGADDPRGDKFIACLNTLYPGGPQLPADR